MRSEIENRPEISVIVCTRNRETMLARHLPAFAAIKTSNFQYEFILVDNGSCDGMGKVFSEFQRGNPEFPGRYVFEPAPGLARARNRGIESAGGKILAFTDDDAVPESDWLLELYRGFHKYPDADGIFGWVGGPQGISSLYSLKQEEVETVYSDRRQVDQVGHGNNMAFRKKLFTRLGLFDQRLGAGSKWESAEDTEFVYRLLAKGGQVVYFPTARVTHYPDVNSHPPRMLVRGYDRGFAFFLGNYFARGDLAAARVMIGLVCRILLQRGYEELKRRSGITLEMKVQSELVRVPRLVFCFLRGMTG